LLDMLVHSAGTHDTPYAQLLKEEMETLQSAGEHYVFHEHLEDINEPLYFHQFVKRAAAKGLQYLGEAQSYEGAGRIDPSAAQWLMQQTKDAVRREQYCDFIMSRRFRWTLLCHDDQPVDHTPDPRREASGRGNFKLLDTRSRSSLGCQGYFRLTQKCRDDQR